MSESPLEMARTWLRAWATHDLSLLRLAPEACDWLFVKDGVIREVNAYYNSATNRAALDM